jgi:hypothetical protein
MKFIALGPLFSTQSALGDVAEVKDAVGFAEIADNWPANVVWTVDECTLSAAASLAEVGSEQPVKATFLFRSRLPGGVGHPIEMCGSRSAVPCMEGRRRLASSVTGELTSATSSISAVAVRSPTAGSSKRSRPTQLDTLVELVIELIYIGLCQGRPQHKANLTNHRH